MDDVHAWFDTYLEAFAAIGRGTTSDPVGLLEFYDVPLLLTTDQGAMALTTRDAVVALVRQQADRLRDVGYDRSEVLDLDVEALNRVSALVRGSFARRAGDGSELVRLRVTYLVADGDAGRRIRAIAVHSGMTTLPHDD